MIEFFSEKIATFFVKKNVIEEKEKEIYQYGVELQISAVFSFFIMLFIGFFFCRIIESVVFYISFILIRTYSGGYHAKTHLKCKVSFALAQIAALFLCESLMQADLIYSIICLTISFVVFFVLAPVENPNKKIENPLKMKKIVLTITLLLCVAGYLANYIYAKSFTMIVSSIIVVAALILVDSREKGGALKNNTCNS